LLITLTYLETCNACSFVHYHCAELYFVVVVVIIIFITYIDTVWCRNMAERDPPAQWKFAAAGVR